MVKIYKRNNKVIVEGLGRFIPDHLNAVYASGEVTIRDRASNKIVFQGLKNKMAKENGDTIAEAEINQYLADLTTIDIKLGTNDVIDGGTIF